MIETLKILIPILILVESGGDPNALGDYNKKTGQYDAVGCLQIHKCVVDDVNRIWDEDYTYDYRYDPKKSRQIAIYYLYHYGSHYEKITGLEANAEVLSRIWNGGPTGYKKESTVKYWEKVKKQLN